MENSQITYAEILILGKCYCRCFYCLGNEMEKASKFDHMSTNYSKWADFESFIWRCKAQGIDKIYISSVNTDPLAYSYITDLISYLNCKFKYVGIRGNAASLDCDTYHALDKCTEEISISLNSTDSDISRRIAGERASLEWVKLRAWLARDAYYKSIGSFATTPSRRVRIATVVNRFNYQNIPDILDSIASFNDFPDQPAVSYVQLRKVYKYSDDKGLFKKDYDAYENLKKRLTETLSYDSSFHESDVYIWNCMGKTLKVSFWDNVFPEKSIKSFNYFTNGKVSENTLLVPGFENE